MVVEYCIACAKQFAIMCKLATMERTCNPRTIEAEVGSPGVQGYSYQAMIPRAT